ncbi:MAG: hypothetical protein F3743_02850 [Nitrospinae bacterium]|nr:hypothetical protein [Nitrospinota bacterium]MZH14499.1 hypothetical protein [Nitrospinota bacterium]
MNSKGNPILIEMADQLPEASKAFQLITASVDYPSIIEQAREDFYCFADLEKERESGMTGLATLKENGYGSWLNDMEEEDRLRICGVLQMIADLAQELDQE